MFITKKLLTSLKTCLFRFLTVTMFTVILLQSAPLQVAWAEEENPAAGYALGLVSFAASIPYGCVKIAYATLGAIVGGFTYVLTGANADAGGAIWNKSMNGDYVLTPAHLTGKKTIRFFGDIGQDPEQVEPSE